MDNPAPNGITILVVDDHELVRFGLESYFKSSSSSYRVIVAGTLGKALDILASESVCIVLLDLNLPDSKGLSTLALLHRAYPELPVAVISGADQSICEAVEAMGAVKFFSKSGDLDQVGQWVQQQATNLLGVEIPQQVNGLHQAQLDRLPQACSRLLPRQLEVLELVLAGKSNQDICQSTGLSLGTVKNYVSILLLHFQANSRGHLITLLK
ncbi:MAG: two component transcriptional regulator LuxR family [Comamonadaceae bacterium]|nr:MAG: two component transcriptional regulator LuxR family [Comamonadaceae bacterium]